MRIRNLAALITLLVLGSVAFGQYFQRQSCPGGQCPTPMSPTVTVISSKPAKVTAHGWYRHESGFIERYENGRSVEVYLPDEKGFDAAVERMPWNIRSALGLAVGKTGVVSAKPKGCVCDDCKCKDCPHSCTVANMIDELFAFTSDNPTAAPRDKFADGFDDPLPGGVVKEKIPQRVSYICNGLECPKERAYEGLLGRPYTGDLVDDRHKMFLTVVGPESLRSKVLNDFLTNPELKVLGKNLHLKFYDRQKDFWPNEIGLADGITLQQGPSTTKSPVIWRMENYNGDALALAEAIRKADPNYKPDADPDPNKPSNPKQPDPSKPDGGGIKLPEWLTWQTAVLGAVIGFLLLRNRKG